MGLMIAVTNVLVCLAGIRCAWAIDPEARQLIVQLRERKLPCDLDPVFAIPANWDLTPKQLDAEYRVPEDVPLDANPYFRWLTQQKDRAHFSRRPFPDLEVELFLFNRELRLEDAIVDFRAGKINGITFSIYNRGDSGELDPAEFTRRSEKCRRELSQRLGVRPFFRKAAPRQGLLSEGWVWTSERGIAMLEYNPEACAEDPHPEFLRLRIAPRQATGGLAASISERNFARRVTELKRNVRRYDYGAVRILGIPMVDQGPKGYCVVASCQRVFEYFGIPSSQHQLAQIANADAVTGTSPRDMAAALDRIDYRFKTRFKELLVGVEDGPKYDVCSKAVKLADAKTFRTLVRKHIDEGIPLFWGVALGLHPESPDLTPQDGGYHMRLITGYHSKSGDVIFTDSWGAGHERKEMDLEYAFAATTCLFVMKPSTR